MNITNKTPDGSYIFNVEFNISATSRGAALEQLLHALADSNFSDYRIESDKKPSTKDVVVPTPAPPKKIAVKAPTQPDPFELRIRQYIESNKLLRLNINKGLGVTMSIPCRVINFDADTQLLTVYHVDEKQVYSVGLNEIDDFID
ncbi:hypothetical protein [Cohnella sp. WQ 127256]|uniref:hypothetical protein n=1 Tax=Cohnella sp. WQ 127256 TaxID=2938790 RepID=UPI0021192789|nr:hypothetical protein [Cohnella sp. WQ 127256]